MNLKNELAVKEIEISDLKQIINDQDARIINLTNMINSMDQEMTHINAELEGARLEIEHKNEEINNLKISIQESEKFRTLNNTNPWNNNQLMQSYKEPIQNNKIGFVGCDSLDYNEKLIAVNITSSDSHIDFSIICKENTQFVDVEKKIYEKYPEYKGNDGQDNLFLGKGCQIDKNQTMAQNFPSYCITLMKNNFDN